jgi:hydroxymethylbilane synthase
MKLVLGTRGSALARAQSETIAVLLRGLGHEVATEVIQTTGDRLSELEQPIEGKGIFTRELDQALRDGRIDFAVHSLKDLPSEIPKGLALAAVPPREDPRDAVISRAAVPLAELPPGSIVGTGSARRIGQIRRLYPDLHCVEARGNVDTRIRKLSEGRWDAVVLALAGLRRLGRDAEATEVLAADGFLPAVGQGALAIVTRRDETAAALGAVDDAATRAAVRCERRILRDLEGGCRAPIAAYAALRGGSLSVAAAVFSTDGRSYLREERSADASDPETLGAAVASALIARGAAEIVARARGNEPSAT